MRDGLHVRDITAFLECIRDNRLPPDVHNDLQKWFPRVQDVVSAIVYNADNGRQIYADFCATPTRFAFPDINIVIGRADTNPSNKPFLYKCLWYLYMCVNH